MTVQLKDRDEHRSENISEYEITSKTTICTCFKSVYKLNTYNTNNNTSPVIDIDERIL